MWMTSTTRPCIEVLRDVRKHSGPRFRFLNLFHLHPAIAQAALQREQASEMFEAWAHQTGRS